MSPRSGRLQVSEDAADGLDGLEGTEAETPLLLLCQGHAVERAVQVFEVRWVVFRVRAKAAKGIGGKACAGTDDLELVDKWWRAFEHEEIAEDGDGVERGDPEELLAEQRDDAG